MDNGVYGCFSVPGGMRPESPAISQEMAGDFRWAGANKTGSGRPEGNAAAGGGWSIWSPGP